MNSIKVRNLTIGEGKPKICVPIVGRTEREILAQAERIREIQAEIVELRAYWFEEVDAFVRVKAVLEKIRQVLEEVPILFTFRKKGEGG